MSMHRRGNLRLQECNGVATKRNSNNPRVDNTMEVVLIIAEDLRARRTLAIFAGGTGGDGGIGNHGLCQTAQTATTSVLAKSRPKQTVRFLAFAAELQETTGKRLHPTFDIVDVRGDILEDL